MVLWIIPVEWLLIFPVLLRRRQYLQPILGQWEKPLLSVGLMDPCWLVGLGILLAVAGLGTIVLCGSSMFVGLAYVRMLVVSLPWVYWWYSPPV